MTSTPLPQQRASRSNIKDPSQGFANSDEWYPPLLLVGKPITTPESIQPTGVFSRAFSLCALYLKVIHVEKNIQKHFAYQLILECLLIFYYLFLFVFCFDFLPLCVVLSSTNFKKLSNSNRHFLKQPLLSFAQ